MTPCEFEKRMAALKEINCPDGCHQDADKLMCQVLKSLGYEKGVVLFEQLDKWYA